jgi:hypothetical protein
MTLYIRLLTYFFSSRKFEVHIPPTTFFPSLSLPPNLALLFTAKVSHPGFFL